MEKATPLQRLGASLIDSLIILIIALVPAAVLLFLFFPDGNIPFSAEIVGGIVLNAILALYKALTERFWNGQTIGKRLLRIRVVRDDGTPAGLGALILRELVCVAPAVVRPLNALVLIIDAVLIHSRPDGKAVHDFAGRTVVVRG